MKGGDRGEGLGLIVFFVGYNGGGEKGCGWVGLVGGVVDCGLGGKKVKGGVGGFFMWWIG